MIRKSDVLHTAVFAGCVALGMFAAQYYYKTASPHDPSFQIFEPLAQAERGRNFSLRGFMGIGFGLAFWVLLMLLYLAFLRITDFVLTRIRPAEPADLAPEPEDDTPEEDDNSFTVEDGKDD